MLRTFLNSQIQNDSIKTYKFLPQTKKIIKKLTTSIKNKHTKLNIKLSKIPEESYPQKPDCTSNIFISDDLKEEISKFNDRVGIEASSDDKKITFDIMFNSDETSQRLINKICRKLAGRYFVVKDLFDRDTDVPNYYVVICLSWTEKKIKCQSYFDDLNDCVLGPDEVNSGSSYLYRKHLTLWRIEEIDKVFLHEIIHGLHLDHINKPFMVKYLRDKFSLPSSIDIKPGEAYTEVWATILNCVFNNVEKSRNIPNKELTKKVLRCIKMEQIFSIIQASKLLKYYKSDYWDLRKWRQYTSVFSYYILESIFLYYIDRFIEWHLKWNQNKFEPNGNLISGGWKVFMDTILYDANYEKALDNAHLILEKAPKKIKNTMRMAAITFYDFLD